MTLPSRHRILNSSLGSLRPSMLLLGHRGSPQYWIQEWAGKKHFISFKLKGRSGLRTRDLRLIKQAALTTAPAPPPSLIMHFISLLCIFMLWSSSSKTIGSSRERFQWFTTTKTCLCHGRSAPCSYYCMWTDDVVVYYLCLLSAAMARAH